MQLTKYVLAILLIKFSLIFSAQASNSTANDSRIIGGSDVQKPTKFPFYALLGFQLPDQFCGGSIIAKDWVVTAQHCTAGKPPETIWVHAGFLDSTQLSFQQRQQVKRKFEYPNYQDFKKFDVALLKLEYPFFLYSFIRPIRLPHGFDDLRPNFSECTVIGFGWTTTTGQPDPTPAQHRKLKEAELQVVPRSHCRNSWGEQVDESHICASQPNQEIGACYGDSGGPLACKDKEGEWVLRGVFSYMYDGCQLKGHAPDVFTRVSFYVDWIKDTTRYGPWVNGKCSVSCGEGTRLDVRTCAGDNCQDPYNILHRVSKCKKPDCEDGRDVCRELECSPDAVCEEEEGKFGCGCQPEFEGDGFDCSFEANYYVPDGLLF